MENTLSTTKIDLRNWTDGKVMIDDEIIHTCCQR